MPSPLEAGQRDWSVKMTFSRFLVAEQTKHALIKMSDRLAYSCQPDGIQLFNRVSHLQRWGDERLSAIGLSRKRKVLSKGHQNKGLRSTRSCGFSYAMHSEMSTHMDRHSDREGEQNTHVDRNHCFFCDEVCISFVSSFGTVLFILLLFRASFSSSVAFDRSSSSKFSQTIEIVPGMSCSSLVPWLFTL